MVPNFSGLMAYAGLVPEAENVRFSPASSWPSKLNPAKCEMTIGEATISVTLDVTLAKAAGGGQVGTELPPDQIL